MIRATDTTWPFVCLQTSGSSTPADIAEIMPLFNRVFARGQKHISFSDARFANHDAAQRKLWADFTNATMEGSIRCAVATVVVLDGALLRGALTALNWLAPPKIPQHVAGNLDEALRMARSLALAHGLTVTPETMHDLERWLRHREARVAV